jgi:hypothetical protein
MLIDCRLYLQKNREWLTLGIRIFGNMAKAVVDAVRVEIIMD